MNSQAANAGVVIIGRNEGERFKTCIHSVLKICTAVVYVDSGSDDGSPEYAAQHGVEVVHLDLSIPFSAGRARNEGFERLLALYPDLQWVQFVDGDCELILDWPDAALEFLKANEIYAVACGRRSEKFPDATPFNKLCDIEWNTPVGDARSCGGDFMVSAKAFSAVQGFNPNVIAGEEPEMCFRLRRLGYKIMRLKHDMTRHDAQMDNIKQWWLRAKRCGHAYAQGESLHGASSEKYNRKQVRSALIWGCALLCLPMLGLVLVLSGVSPWALLAIVAPFGALAAKIFIHAYHDKSLPFKSALLLSVFTVMAKLPELVGVLTFKARQRSQEKMEIIEYK